MKDTAINLQSGSTEQAPLAGATILIVEDEALVAHDLALTIEENGGRADGPIHRLDQAMAYADFQKVDAALLDVDIAGSEVFTFADRLWAAAVPIVFHTARADVSRLRAHYPDAAVLCKPCLARGVVAALSSVMRLQPIGSRAAT